NPQASADVTTAVQEASRRARSAPASISLQTSIAHGLVRSLFEEGRIDAREIHQFAEQRKFDETNQAIACLANIPVSTAEA
ncbi:DUF2336 domain-containing protein, partial [Salmonella enterica subsp. enterica serovar Typhimurium]|nr:DUF2336 domain-containing protein [Salmonella enterica subsp. enterica serovar Typhimurium]